MICSIITINYNNSEGLARTLESVKSQSFVDFEHIIIDGGSTDGGVDMIETYADEIANRERKYPVIWSSERDSGVFNAMNKGIKCSHGDYLLFLNSGDYLVDDDVLKQVFSAHRNADIVIGKCRVSKNEEVKWIACPQATYTFDYFFHGSMAHQASFFHRDLFDRLGLYREDLHLMSDWAFSLEAVILQGATVDPIDVLVSDYNCEGMSSDPANCDRMNKERDRVFHDLHLDRIVPDYKSRDEDNKKYTEMKWAWSKGFIRKAIHSLYHIAVILTRKKNESSYSSDNI